MELLKENAENAFALGPRNKISVQETIQNRIKHVAKPLTDVKNILSDKGCLSVPKERKATNVDVYTKTSPKELVKEIDEDPLYFFEERVDDYCDILPRDLQLTKDDISKLACVFDVPSKPYTPDYHMEPIELPENNFYFSDDDSMEEFHINGKMFCPDDLFDISYKEVCFSF